jgi:hypothetical protein
MRTTGDMRVANMPCGAGRRATPTQDPDDHRPVHSTPDLPMAPPSAGPMQVTWPAGAAPASSTYRSRMEEAGAQLPDTQCSLCGEELRMQAASSAPRVPSARAAAPAQVPQRSIGRWATGEARWPSMNGIGALAVYESSEITPIVPPLIRFGAAV